jgi:adenylate kinase family enzyme
MSASFNQIVKRGWILDGFPPDSSAGEELDRRLAKSGLALKWPCDVRVTEAEAIERIPSAACAASAVRCIIWNTIGLRARDL